MKEEVIRLENVVKMDKDGKRVINGVTMSIAAGECVVISGSSGSGKTTLMRLIAGLEKPSAGSVFVCGKPLHEMKSYEKAALRNKHIGILQRSPTFMDTISVFENVAMPLAIRRETAVQRCKKTGEQLMALGLLHASHARPPQLSLLERHKIAIARALIVQPKILLLDDFSADIVQTDEIAGTLRVLCRYGECTMIELTDKNKGLICEDRHVLLEHGKIREEQK